MGTSPLHRIFPYLRRAEDTLCVAALLFMGLLPVIEIVLRAGFRTGIPGSTGYVQNLTLWVGFMGAMLASRQRQHLSLSTGMVELPEKIRKAIAMSTGAASSAVATGLAWAGFEFVRYEMESPTRIGGWLPVWMAEAVLPLAFFVMAARFVLQAGGWRAQGGAALGILAAVVTGFWLEDYAGYLLWPGIVLLVASALIGAPIFVVLGGAALLLFFADGVPVAAISAETYRLAVSPAIPTIPLFTLTGFLLAEGGASRRLVRLFRALFGWLPGGLAVAATLVCAFFATFTGASGVTILALGGLLLPVLLQNAYPEKFSVGLLAATGSIGILFPPSLAVILYGVVAHVPIPDLFKAGLVPGLILVGTVGVYGVYIARRAKVPRPAFDPAEARGAVWESKWEILLPVVALVGIFGGYTTLIEAAAITVVYALFVEVVIHREMRLFTDVPKVLLKSSTLVGGVFVILGAAMGLTNYLVDAEIPMQAAAWATEHIESRVMFLLALNLFLLVVGCLMDIFSATVVVVPLILPMAEAFGIDPLHLGMIFLVNLELGYLTPPVGMNLFLTSFRLERPLFEVYRAALPFLLLFACVVLLITYVPGLIIGL